MEIGLNLWQLVNVKIKEYLNKSLISTPLNQRFIISASGKEENKINHSRKSKKLVVEWSRDNLMFHVKHYLFSYMNQQNSNI